MNRLQPVVPDTSNPELKDMYEEVKEYLGFVPNLLRQMANSPAVLRGYIAFSKSLQKGKLDKQLREQIALAIAQANSCQYCVSAHTALGRLFGLPQEELSANLRGTSDSPRTAKALRFALRVFELQGKIPDDEFFAMKEAGFTEEEISEIIAAVAVNIFSNFFNHVAEPELDFPAVDVGVNELVVANW